MGEDLATPLPCGFGRLGCARVGVLSSIDGRTDSNPVEKSGLKVPRSVSAAISEKSDISPPLDSESVDHECPSGDDPPRFNGSASVLSSGKLKSSVSAPLMVSDERSGSKVPKPSPKLSKSNVLPVGSSIFRAIIPNQHGTCERRLGPHILSSHKSELKAASGVAPLEKQVGSKSVDSGG